MFDGICTPEFELDDDEEAVVATFDDKPACAIVGIVAALVLVLKEEVTSELVLLEILLAAFAFMDGLGFGDELFRLIIWNSLNLFKVLKIDQI